MNTDLAILYIKGIASPEEKQKFEIWLTISEENYNEFAEFRKYWELSEKAYHNFNPDTLKAWRKVDTSINQTSRFNNRALINSFKIAASIVIIISVGFFLYKSALLRPEKLIVFNSEKGIMQLVLSDSTKIWLNAGSELRAPKRFNAKKRNVYLKGEAFFQVAKNLNKPFIISTESSKIEVLGTSFNVKSEASDSIVKVDVVTGVVAFSSSVDKFKRVILKKGQKATFDKLSGNILKEQNLNMNFIAWKTGKLSFRNASLNEISSTLAEFYHLHSEFQTDSISKKYSFTGSFDHESLSAALKIIELTTGVKYKCSGDSIKIISIKN